MNFKLSKKLKTLLWTSSAIVLNTAIASSLTSCSLFNKDVVDDIGGYDKQYGITQATYDKMENDFKEIYETDLETKHEQGDIDDEQHESSLSSFRSSLNSFHNTLNSKEYKTYSYTVKTNALRDFAKDNYGIRLARYTGVNLEDEIGQIKNSMIMNLSMMIDEYNVGAEKGKELINNASDAFEGYVNDAKEAYPNGDILSIIQYIQDKMVGCFDGICKEIDVIVTQKFLSDFLKNATIDVNQDVSEGKVESCCWNNLNYNKGQPIKEEDFNDIFDIKVKEFIPSLNSSLVSESTKIIPFRKDMITGYTLVPIVYDMVGDPFKNEYQIQIDYTLVNNRYANDTDVAKATVHSAIPLDQAIYENDDNDVYDINVNDGERQPSSYELPITKDYEENQIKYTYFNPTDFNCTWSKSADYGFDNFWVDEKNEEDKLIGTLNKNGLSDTGMMINGILLSDLLYQAQFSLSGGKTELNGSSSKSCSDENQWKLYKNGELANSIKIKDWQLIPAESYKLPNDIYIDKACKVSWNKGLEAGTYKFYVVANYLAEKDDQSKDDVIFKCKSDLITLRIIDESNTNITNQNTYLKSDVKFNDESDDEKQWRLVDLVKNTNFSLNYEEISTDSQIKTNWFQFCYTYHPLNISEKRVFQINNNSADDNDLEVFNTLTNKINAENGVTKRTSRKLYSNVQEDYKKIKNDYTFDSLIKNLESEKEHDENFIIAAIIITTVVSVFVVAIVILGVNRWNNDNKSSSPYTNAPSLSETYLFLILASIGIILMIVVGIAICIKITEKIDDLSNSLKDIKTNATSNYALVKNIKDDEQYFEGDEAQVKWNKKENDFWRSKKYYYQGGYKESKGKDASDKEIPSDCDEYLGGKKNAEKVRNDASDLLVACIVGIVIVGIIVILILVFLAYIVCKFRVMLQKVSKI